MKTKRIDGDEGGFILISRGVNGEVIVTIEERNGESAGLIFNYAQALLLQSAFKACNSEYDKERGR